MPCRSKISFACKEQEIKGALEPHVDADLLYASLGGTKPDDSYSFDRLDTLMRSLDKVYLTRHRTLPLQWPASWQVTDVGMLAFFHTRFQRIHGLL